MPYIAIKSFPKDEATKKKLVDQINQTFLDIWGCPQEAISISLEEVGPSDWDAKVRKPEIETRKDQMMILDGKKKY